MALMVELLQKGKQMEFEMEQQTSVIRGDEAHISQEAKTKFFSPLESRVFYCINIGIFPSIHNSLLALLFQM